MNVKQGSLYKMVAYFNFDDTGSPSLKPRPCSWYSVEKNSLVLYVGLDHLTGRLLFLTQSGKLVSIPSSQLETFSHLFRLLSGRRGRLP